MSPIKNWFPYKLTNNEGEWMCHWLNSFKKPFVEPFFDETIIKLKSAVSKQLLFSSASEMGMLEEWAGQVKSIEPAAFIFHVSRCGSTLAAQLLAKSANNIVLSEVPFFDNLLRLPYRDNRFSENDTSDFLKAAIRFYGQKKTGHEQHLFIKTDSWHMFFYKQLRQLYPKVPFVLMYRRPNEVFDSQKKLPGMHAVPGLIEPELFGFDDSKIDVRKHDSYLSMVLERYFTQYHEIVDMDKNTLLINYDEGPMAILKKIAAYTTMPIDQQYLTDIEERSRYHSKKPNEVFSEVIQQQVPAFLDKAMELYCQLEEKRIAFYNQEMTESD